MNAMTPVPSSLLTKERAIKEQVVLVLQGGGALGAYQAGVYQALMEGGIEPDWVIGTSIGAINGALIAGNAPENRVARLQEFWNGVGAGHPLDQLWPTAIFGNASANMATLMAGIPGFFAPNPKAIWGPTHPLGVEHAAWYTTAPLRQTLGRLVDFEHLGRRQVRLSVGAVNVRSGEMRYFDSNDMPLAASHIMASGALPPAFPAVDIDGEHYWDGGIYSNTPIEVVLEDVPRRNSLIFSVNVWQPTGDHPVTIQQVTARHKDIQFASRGKTHVARQVQLHRLRHVVRELAKRLPPGMMKDPVIEDLADYGCGTQMHLVRFLAPRLDGEDHTKDIDFTRPGIARRWKAGFDHATRALHEKPWEQPVDPLAGIVIHESAT
ncbi:MAG TPA: patatin-like phospholipase family protein [Reyranella sp.]|nr:patatin-like phospholipase family protein [Reyranella sp.]